MQRHFFWVFFLIALFAFSGPNLAYGDCPAVDGNAAALPSNDSNGHIGPTKDSAGPILERTLLIRIAPALSPLTLHLIPDVSAPNTWDVVHHVGRVEVCKQGSSVPFQTIEFNAYPDVSLWISNFHILDVNFDGYADLGALYDFGAKFGSYQFWIFDPKSQRFVQNQLTDELREIRANDDVFDPASKTIHSQYLNFNEGVIGETYQVSDDHLVLIEVEERVKDDHGEFQAVKRKP